MVGSTVGWNFDQLVGWLFGRSFLVGWLVIGKSIFLNLLLMVEWLVWWLVFLMKEWKQDAKCSDRRSLLEQLSARGRTGAGV